MNLLHGALRRVEEAEKRIQEAKPIPDAELKKRVQEAEAEALAIIQADQKETPYQARIFKIGDAMATIRAHEDGTVTAGTGLWVSDNTHIADQLMTLATNNLASLAERVERSDQLSNARTKAAESKKRPDPLKALCALLVARYFEGLAGKTNATMPAAWRAVVLGLQAGDELDVWMKSSI
jgi:hypothetical protein